METVEIGAELRDRTGKGPSRRLRAAGRIPATFYGPHQPALSIHVDAREFAAKVLALEGSHLIRLRSSAPELSGRVVLVRDAMRHPVTGRLLHADLYEVDLTKRVTVQVPLHFVGKAAGVVAGGILQPIAREVEVECLPTDIPEFLTVDVTPLGIHDAIHVSQLTTPPGVRVRYDTDYTVVTVLPPTVEEVAVEAAAEAPTEAVAAPEAEAAKPEASKAEPE